MSSRRHVLKHFVNGGDKRRRVSPEWIAMVQPPRYGSVACVALDRGTIIIRDASMTRIHRHDFSSCFVKKNQ